MNLVEVYVAMDLIEAEVAAEILRALGLTPQMRDRGISGYPIAIGPLGEKRLTVPEEEAESARRALREAVADGILAGEILTGDPGSRRK